MKRCPQNILSSTESTTGALILWIQTPNYPDRKSMCKQIVPEQTVPKLEEESENFIRNYLLVFLSKLFIDNYQKYIFVKITILKFSI